MWMALLPATLWAAEIQVGPGQAHGSIGSAVQAAGPGDVIQVHPGTYSESLELGPGGEAGSPIRIEATREHQAQLQGTIDLEGDHWELVGLAIEVPNGTDGIRIDGSHNRLLRLDLSGGTRDGIDGGGEGNEVRESEIHDFDAGNDDAHCIVLNPGAQGWVIADNDLHDCSGDGIQLYADGAERTILDTVIERNTIHYTGSIGRTENAIDVKNADGLTIRHNVMQGFGENKTMVFQKGPANVEVTCNTMFDGFTGVEFRGEDGGTVEHVVFAYNLMVGYQQYSLKFDGTVGAQVFNNTFVDVQGDGLRIEGDGLSDGTVQNNLWLGVQRVESGGFVADHNGFFDVGDVQIGSGSDVTSDPELDGDHRIGEGSPLVDAGVDVGYPTEGAAPDIGWDELGGDPCAALPGGDDGGNGTSGDGGDDGSDDDGSGGGNDGDAGTGPGGVDTDGEGSGSGAGPGPGSGLSGTGTSDTTSDDGCGCTAKGRRPSLVWCGALVLLAWVRRRSGSGPAS